MTDLISSDAPFNAEQQAALKAIVGYMIPAGSNRPAASEEAIFMDILGTLKDQPEVVRQVLEIYQNTDLKGLSQMRSPAVSALVSVTVQCYYRDTQVLQSLTAEARPPHPQGYEVAQGDFSLLDPVRARGPIYRRV